MAETLTLASFLQAVRGGCTEEVAQSIKIHSDFIDSPDPYGMTPLHWAAWKGQDSIAELLLRSGSQTLDALDSHSMTPLHYAARFGRCSTVELLLRFGSQALNSLSFTLQWTPLQYALTTENKEKAHILRAVGASPDFDLEEFEPLTPVQIEMLREPILEEEVLEIRFRIYLGPSLVSHVLFFL